MLMLDLDTLQYSSLLNLINITENPISAFACETAKIEDENESFISFQGKHTS